MDAIGLMLDLKIKIKYFLVGVLLHIFKFRWYYFLLGIIFYTQMSIDEMKVNCYLPFYLCFFRFNVLRYFITIYLKLLLKCICPARLKSNCSNTLYHCIIIWRYISSEPSCLHLMISILMMLYDNNDK